MPSALSVFSLVCRRDLEIGITCLQSLVRHCKDSVQVIGISDGSLDAHDLRRFRAEVPGACFLDRADVASQVDSVLEAFPHCQAFRRVHAWALKLIDIPLYAATESVKGDFAFVDSDVLFVRDFRGLDRRDADDVRMAFMHAYANIYSLKLPQRLRRWGRTPLVDRCNSGMMYVSGSAYDLNAVELFLSNAVHHANILLAEQTGWAALAARSPSGYFAPEQITFPFTPTESSSNGEILREDIVALHFVGGTRHLIPRLQAAAFNRSQDKAREVNRPLSYLRVQPSRRLRLPSQAWDILRHRIHLRRWQRAGISN